MRILLTGASGFLGRRLRRELRQKKHDVFCYDITLGYNIMYPDQIENTIINWKPDTVIHLAALADLNIFKEKPEFGHQLNVVGTRNVLNLCQKYKLRLLFASTCCCYGNNNIHMIVKILYQLYTMVPILMILIFYLIFVLYKFVHLYLLHVLF